METEDISQKEIFSKIIEKGKLKLEIPEKFIEQILESQKQLGSDIIKVNERVLKNQNKIIFWVIVSILTLGILITSIIKLF